MKSGSLSPKRACPVMCRILIRIILKMIFYHNTEISSALIGRALWLIKVQFMWKWRCDGGAIGFLYLVRVISRTSTEMDVKSLSVIGKNKQTNKQTNQQQFSMVYTLIEHRNDVKMSKSGSETTRLRPVVPLEFLKFWRHFMVDKSMLWTWKFVVRLLTSAFLAILAVKVILISWR